MIVTENMMWLGFGLVVGGSIVWALLEIIYAVLRQR